MVAAEKIRTFIAIRLDSEIKSELASIQNELKKCEADVKWVKSENIHITLKFLGYVLESQLKDVFKAFIGSNNRKMIWVRPLDTTDKTSATIAHEFQHLIYFGHDQKPAKDTTWLNEGLSVYSVDLNNYWSGHTTYENRLTYF